jgi:hypothetical protein
MELDFLYVPSADVAAADVRLKSASKTVTYFTNRIAQGPTSLPADHQLNAESNRESTSSHRKSEITCPNRRPSDARSIKDGK